jgi:two-component system sensor histidine kinase DesK
MKAFIDEQARTEQPWIDHHHSKYKSLRPQPWLFFSLFYFFPLFQWEPAPEPWRIATSVAIYLTFIVLFLISMQCGRYKTALYVSIASVILCTLTVGINPGSSTLFGYTGFILGYYLRSPYSIIGNSILLVCLILSGWFFNVLYGWFIIPGAMIIVGMTIMSAAVRKEHIAVYRAYRSEQQVEQLATVAERERIARDLHDILGHTLTSILLKSQLAKKLCINDNKERALKELEEICRISADALSDVRATVTGYKAKTLGQLVTRLSDRLVDKGIVSDIEGDFNGLSPKAEAAIGLILTEAITNIQRHSHADHVVIRGERLGDNGKGQAPVKGNGLVGIEERAAEFAGHCDINTEQGFRLTVTLTKDVFND